MTKLVLLHGLGQSKSDWNQVIDELKCETVNLDLFEGINEKSVISLERIYKNISMKINEIEEPFYLCGLSLGGLLALMYATRENTDKLAGIIIAGAIYKGIPKKIIALQSIMFKIVPKSVFKKMGLSRQQAISLIKSITINMENDLKRLSIPSLIICGDKDKVNIKSSEELHRLLENSQLIIVPNGRHELNKQKPDLFSQLINNFLQLEI